MPQKVGGGEGMQSERRFRRPRWGGRGFCGDEVKIVVVRVRSIF